MIRLKNIKQAAELIKTGAKVYHLADGTYKFVDGYGKVLEADKLLQDAMDAGIFADAVLGEAADELVNEGLGEVGKAAIDFALAACTIQ